MTDHHPHNANSPRPLSPWNPLDHLRLLWWVLVTPQQLKAYREAFGERAERSMGKWLASTLLWLPPFIPTLAMGLGALPGAETARLPTIYLWVSAGLTLAWVLTGWLGEETGCSATVVALNIILFVLAGVVSLGPGGNVAGGAEGVVAASVAIGVAVGVAPVVPGGVPVVVALVVASSTASIVAGPLAFLVTFVVVLAVAGRVASVVKESMNNGRPSWLAQAALGALVLAYAFLIWFSLLGGWRVFQ